NACLQVYSFNCSRRNIGPRDSVLRQKSPLLQLGGQIPLLHSLLPNVLCLDRFGSNMLSADSPFRYVAGLYHAVGQMLTKHRFYTNMLPLYGIWHHMQGTDYTGLQHGSINGSRLKMFSAY